MYLPCRCRDGVGDGAFPLARLSSSLQDANASGERRGRHRREPKWLQRDLSILRRCSISATIVSSGRSSKAVRHTCFRTPCNSTPAFRPCPCAVRHTRPVFRSLALGAARLRAAWSRRRPRAHRRMRRMRARPTEFTTGAGAGGELAIGFAPPASGHDLDTPAIGLTPTSDPPVIGTR